MSRRMSKKTVRVICIIVYVLITLVILAALWWLGLSAWKWIYYSDLPDWLKFLLLRS